MMKFMNKLALLASTSLWLVACGDGAEQSSLNDRKGKNLRSISAVPWSLVRH